MKVTLVGINARYSHSALALFYVRNELEKHCPGLCCRLLQLTINDNYYQTLLRLGQDSPSALLFSAAIWNSAVVERLCRDLRQCLPHCQLVIGGPQAGVLCEKLADLGCAFVFGEIEAVGEDFYRHLLAGELQPSYRGAFFHGKARDFSFPYQDADFNDHLRHRHVYYESSKGCPFSCAYCLSAAEKGLYHKELPVVFQELGQILGHRPKVVRFIDRTFNDLPHRALAIWKFLAAEGGETLFHFEMAPDRFTEEMFAFLATLPAGRFQFELGVQSTNPQTLRAVNRPIDSDQAHRAVRRLAALGTIHLHVDLILGLPYETLDSFAASFRAVFAMEAHYIQMGLLKILPDTPISRCCQEYGYRFCQEPPYAVLESRWLSHGQLGHLYWFSELVEKFYNTRYFPSLWRYLRLHGEDSFAFFSDLLALGQERGLFQRAATQEFLCELLCEMFAARWDRSVLLDLLRHDWLRCGFRFLPDCLATGLGEAPEETRSRLYLRLPETWPGLYDRAGRNHFFRKAYFLRLNEETIAEAERLGLPRGEICCYAPEKEGGLFSWQRTVGIGEGEAATDNALPSGKNVDLD